MPTFSHLGSRIQGSKRHPIPDPGSGSETLQYGDHVLKSWMLFQKLKKILSIFSRKNLIFEQSVIILVLKPGSGLGSGFTGICLVVKYQTTKTETK
jgi:hypothetical protein